MAQFSLNRLANASLSSSVDGDAAAFFHWFVSSIEPSRPDSCTLAGAQQSFLYRRKEFPVEIRRAEKRAHIHSND
jgi:hypothetical protein